MAAEAVPFSQAGGLGDVIGALAPALAAQGAEVCIVLPAYRGQGGQQPATRKIADLPAVTIGADRHPVTLLESRLPRAEAVVYLLDNKYYFDRPGVYNDPLTGEGYSDNLERYTLFCKAILPALEKIDFSPDIVHLNDYQTALVAAYLKIWYRQHPLFERTGTLYTIHNLAYQGLFPMHRFGVTGLSSNLTRPGGPFEFYGQMNLMKSGLSYADLISTVSEQYAREIQTPEFGVGLEGVLQQRAHELFGILNGVDYTRWDPETDTLIPFRYGPDQLDIKSRNKTHLQEAFGLKVSSEIPLVGMISRLAEQKGLDLVLEALDRILSLRLQMVLLGSGRRSYQQSLQRLHRRHPDRLAVSFGFNEKLAHLIEAASDVFLMPSRYEPCGLNQMYSLKYGTVPVVRHTGGLADTIADFDPQTGQGNGFKFYAYHSEELVSALHRAIDTYKDRATWERVVRNAMSCNFSWQDSARKYLALYRKIQQIRQKEAD